MGRDKHELRRRRSKRKFVQIFHEVIESPAYRSLSVCARAALVELCDRYNGGNNGKISFSVREMAERLKVGKNTANRALVELVKHRLADPTKPEWFSTKHRHATEWRIAARAAGRRVDATDVSAVLAQAVVFHGGGLVGAPHNAAQSEGHGCRCRLALQPPV